jgi:hypothetical protein
MTLGRLGHSRADRRVAIALLVVALVFVGHALYTSDGAVVDDAYIVFRYARNLASGAGLTFQGGVRVEGYTCFSWVLVGAAVARLGLPPEVCLPPLGIGLGALTVMLAASGSGRLAGRAHPGAALPATILSGLFLALSPGLAYFAGSGLETSLFCLLTVLSLTAAVEQRPGRAAAGASLALLTRPEGAFVAALALGAGFARSPRGERPRWLIAALAFATVAVAYAVFKEVYFGALAPNTLAAKPPVLREGLAYAGWGLVDAGPLLVIAAGLGLWRRARAPDAPWLAASAATLAAVATVEGGDWMPAGRLLLPAMCAGAMALGAIAEAVVSLGGSPARSGVCGRFLGLRPLLLGATAAAGAFYVYWSRVDSSSLHERSELARHYEPFRDDIARRLWESGARSVGTLDVGRISYTRPAMRILDLGGLTDPDIARSPGDYRSKRPPVEVLDREAPDAFLLTSVVPPTAPLAGQAPEVSLFYPVEAALAASPWFRARYRLHATLPVRSDYYLHWYERVPVAEPRAGS